MYNLLNKLRYMPKGFTAVLAALLIAIPAVVVVAGWGPERPTYTIEDPAPHVTFNSITNNPLYGDERAFFDAKDESDPSASYKTEVPVEDGDIITLRTYVHNNADKSLNESGVGIAENARVRIHIPVGYDKALSATSYVSADNATPEVVFDQVDFLSDQAFSLDYVEGSAQYKNNVGTFNLPDSIVEDGGTQLGYDEMNGIIPGCFEYDGLVTIQVRVDKTDYTIDKNVRVTGTSDWQTENTAQPGDTLDYYIEFANNDEQKTLQDVLLKDSLPPGIEYVEDTLYLIREGQEPKAMTADLFFKGGVIIGDYAPGSSGAMIFQATVPEEDDLQCGTTTFTNVANAQPEFANDKYNTAITEVTRECENPPVYSCDALESVKLSDTRYDLTAEATAENGATISGYTFYVNDEEVQSSDSNTYQFNESTAGTYTVRVDVEVQVNGGTEVVTSSACETEIEVPEEPIDPIYSCDALDVVELSDTRYELTARATARNGASIDSYVFYVNDNEVQNSDSNEYEFNETTPGTYQVRVDVIVSVDGQTEVVTSNACATEIEVPEEPNQPVYDCTALSIVPVEGQERTFKFTVTTVAENGASLNRLEYNFGDNSETLISNNNMTTYTYANPGEYGVVVRAIFDVNGEQVTVNSPDCTGVIDITKPEQPEVVQGVTTPPAKALPNTGPAGVVATMLGTGAFAAAATSWFESRRALKRGQ